jgi:hypothetical protein
MQYTRTFSPLYALAVIALLSSCGGGSSEAPEAPVIAVQITAPTPQDNVFTAGSPVAVRASATVNGAAMPDGSVVQFSASSGRFSPAEQPSRAGAATSTLTSSAAGPLQISALVTEAGQSGSATLTIYQRPQPARMEILVPAYFYPSTGSDWNRLTASAAAHPTVAITAIMNPNNGNFSRVDGNFTRAVTQFTDAGGKVLGYVLTRYGKGSRSIEDITTAIDRYLELYGRERISGIFLDEMASETTKLGFYREIYQYIKDIDPSLRVVGNPGTVPAAEFSSVVDTLVTFEGTAVDYWKYDPRPNNAWLYRLANSTQAMLAHNAAGCADMQAAVQAAASARNNAGWVYATDLEFNYTTGVGNPWASLPSYWDALVQTVDAVNTGASLPRC